MLRRHPKASRSPALALLLLWLGACGPAAAAGGQADTTPPPTPVAEPTCTSTLDVLQKDAYRELAGRANELWPPHTTTRLTLRCDDTTVDSAEQPNHGTKTDDKDANGAPLLTNTKSLTVSGPRAKLVELMAAYRGCKCETKFLSLDELRDESVQLLVAQLGEYMLAHLTCEGELDAAALVAALEAGKMEQVVAALPRCRWAEGRAWKAGFDEAASKMLAAAKETLAQYHVCNNDARLQAELIGRFDATGDVTACDGRASLCDGPSWFYVP